MPLMTAGQRQGVALVILIGAITIGVVCSFAVALYAASRATSNRASVAQLCASGNEERAKQIHLWQFVISISRQQPGESPEQMAVRQKRIREFQAYLHKEFAPRNCANISGR